MYIFFKKKANSIFVQSQTDFLNCTSVAKKTETCIGRWEHGSMEPLQIHVPPLTSVLNYSIKAENLSSGSSRNKFDGTKKQYTENFATTTTSPIDTTADINSGCSRTIPISWTNHSIDSSTGCTLLQVKFNINFYENERK